MAHTSETTTQAGSSAIGQRIYLDRDQYDSHHIDHLTPMGGATIMAKPAGYGWFEITRVI